MQNQEENPPNSFACVETEPRNIKRERMNCIGVTRRLAARLRPRLLCIRSRDKGSQDQAPPPAPHPTTFPLQLLGFEVEIGRILFCCCILVGHSYKSCQQMKSYVILHYFPYLEYVRTVVMLKHFLAHAQHT